MFYQPICRSQWPCGLRRRSAAARLLRSWVWIPLGAWIFVCCVLSGRGLCDELITHPEESYRMWCVIVCDLETSRMTRPWPALDRSATEKKNKKQHLSNSSLVLTLHIWFSFVGPNILLKIFLSKTFPLHLSEIFQILLPRNIKPVQVVSKFHAMGMWCTRCV